MNKEHIAQWTCHAVPELHATILTSPPRSFNLMFTQLRLVLCSENLVNDVGLAIVPGLPYGMCMSGGPVG